MKTLDTELNIPMIPYVSVLSNLVRIRFDTKPIIALTKAATQSTNIAAVAPGVAEALFTTAVGLIAAIPALIGYNKITHDIDRVTGRMETFSDELTTILETQRSVK